MSKSKVALIVVIAYAVVGFVGLAVGFAVVYSGLYNVGADVPDSAIKESILSTVSDKSVERHSQGIKAPALDGPAMVSLGMEHFNEMCVTCHGAPGVEKSEIGRGLNPEPPDLAKEIGDLSSEEIYWIVKHGIKMTGMPGFGVTHKENELWAMVAFVKLLPKMTAAEYSARLEKEGLTDTEPAAERAAKPGRSAK